MPTTTSDVPEPPICFSRNDMTPAARAARKVLARGRVKSAKSGARKRFDKLGPTPERMAKGDVVGSVMGHYRAPPPIERLRDRHKLAPGDPHQNEALFRAAEKLANVFAASGLSAGAQAQDLNRVVAGSGDAPSGMPLNEYAMAQRQQLRAAIAAMGWYDAYPFRGAARLTMDVVCFDAGVEDSARKHRPGGNDATRLGIGMDVLRDGLFAAAVHWGMLRAGRAR